MDGSGAAAAVQPVLHPLGWRAFMEYGNGMVGDMCVHMLDMVRWMLELGMPRRISCTGRSYRGQVEHQRYADRHVRYGDLQVV